MQSARKRAHSRCAQNSGRLRRGQPSSAGATAPSVDGRSRRSHPRRMNTRKVGVLGSGQVGQILADGFLKHGYEVMRGSREPSKLAAWKAGAGAKASTGTFAEASRFGDLAVLAVKGTAAEDVV